ncbi:MAG: D-2-hydroxyacid dehydrogenase [Deltaproteobacteria bacterium]
MTETKIVVTDGYTLNPEDNPWNAVAALGELTVYARSAANEVVNRCWEADILIVNKTPIRESALGQMPRLKFIAVSATGFDCVDIEAAGRRRIPVSNVPVYGTDSVAQYVFSAILHLWHNIGVHDKAVKAGEWARQPDWSFWQTPLVELRDKTIGIIGFGRIGRRVGQLADAFGMRVLAYDPYPDDPPNYRAFAWCSLEDLFAGSDVVSLHAPLTADNHCFVDRHMLQRMKASAILINASRGGLIEENDLAVALNSGQLAGAVVDVVSTEPIAPDNPLLSARNIAITPHLAWATREARRRLMTSTAENIRAFLDGAPQNIVNAMHLAPE